MQATPKPSPTAFVVAAVPVKDKLDWGTFKRDYQDINLLSVLTSLSLLQLSV